MLVSVWLFEFNFLRQFSQNEKGDVLAVEKGGKGENIALLLQINVKIKNLSGERSWLGIARQDLSSIFNFSLPLSKPKFKELELDSYILKHKVPSSNYLFTMCMQSSSSVMHLRMYLHSSLEIVYNDNMLRSTSPETPFSQLLQNIKFSARY